MMIILICQLEEKTDGFSGLQEKFCVQFFRRYSNPRYNCSFFGNVVVTTTNFRVGLFLFAQSETR